MNLFATGTTFKSLVSSLIGLMSSVLYILIGLGIVFFFYGIVKYIQHPETKQRTALMWSVVALFVLVSFVGLVNILLYTIQPGAPLDLTAPSVQNDNNLRSGLY